MMPANFPVLTRKELAWSLLGLVLLFLFVNGPIWTDPWDVTSSIVYSYLPIPVIVAGLLLVRKRFAIWPWVLHTLELAAAKFMITALILVSIWISLGAPPRARASTSSTSPTVARGTPTLFRADQLTSVKGQVQNARGELVPNALVWIAQGLEEMNFLPSEEEVVLSLDQSGPRPPRLAVQVGQRLRVVSADKTLHTAQVVTSEGMALFNLPVVARPEGAMHVFYQAAEGLEVRCTVHGRRESFARLWVLPHPFFALSNHEGRFQFDGVPRGAIELKAFGEGDGALTIQREP
jgi:hypothetical protein